MTRRRRRFSGKVGAASVSGRPLTHHISRLGSCSRSRLAWGLAPLLAAAASLAVPQPARALAPEPAPAVPEAQPEPEPEPQPEPAPTGPSAEELEAMQRRIDTLERQVEVLRLLAQGLSNREIARRLVISSRTAEHHVQDVYLKIGASTRAAAALFAMEHGLLARPG